MFSVCGVWLSAPMKRDVPFCSASDLVWAKGSRVSLSMATELSVRLFVVKFMHNEATLTLTRSHTSELKHQTEPTKRTQQSFHIFREGPTNGLLIGIIMLRRRSAQHAKGPAKALGSRAPRGFELANARITTKRGAIILSASSWQSGGLIMASVVAVNGDDQALPLSRSWSLSPFA